MHHKVRHNLASYGDVVLDRNSSLFIDIKGNTMKKLIILLAISTPFCANAADFYASTDDIDPSSLPDCNQLSEAVLNGNEGYDCVDFRYEGQPVESKQPNAKNHPDYIHFNDASSTFILNNKGGYFARLIVEWDYYSESTGQTYRNKHVSNYITVGNKTAYNVGTHVPFARVSAELEDLSGWRTIFTDHVQALENKWQSTTRNENKMQWDVWGTIFNAPYKVVQPAGTYDYLLTEYVVLYANENWDDRYLGTAIKEDTPDLGYMGGKTVSWTIPKGWTVRFFAGKNYTGDYWTRTGGKGQEPELRDKFQSVQILSRN